MLYCLPRYFCKHTLYSIDGMCSMLTALQKEVILLEMKYMTLRVLQIQ